MVKIDKKAFQKFNQIPDDIKSAILSNVYCSNCNGTTRIIDFTVEINKTDLILKGICEKCSKKIARLIEG